MKRVTVADAPAVLNTNDKAFWATGWNDCAEVAEAAVKQARVDALEEAASICKAKAAHMESEAQSALADGEEEEDITSLRSSAWLLSVCASSIESLKETP